MISGRPAWVLPRVLLFAAFLAAPLAGADAQAVTAEGGSIAVGGNVSNSTIGLTPEQIRDAMAAVFREESAARAKVEALSDKLNVTNEAVVTFLRILGENQVPLEKLPETLGVIAQRHVEMLDRLEALAPEDPEIQAKVEAARAAIKEGDYDRADQLLSEAEEAERAAIAMAEELEREAREAADRRRLNAAAARAERGEIALTQLNYLRAAGHFEQASKLVPAEDNDRRWECLRRYADALYRHGDERGDNVALLSAIDVYRQALEALPRNRVPLDWATVQNNLGVALVTLDERESGTARLQEAVQAYRAALKERTRERVPLDWAAIQNNLGNALARLGERESGTARLQEAVVAFRAALEERTRERVPLDWAMTQMNLGGALLRLGERESGTARLQEAVAAFRAALKEFTRERVPFDWAMSKVNLGNALARLGERESGTARLQEAVAAFRAALEERTRERVPLDWAMTQMNLGNALKSLGERTEDARKLDEAREAVSGAFAVYMESGQVHYRAYFEDLLRAIDDDRARLQATLKAR